MIACLDWDCRDYQDYRDITIASIGNIFGLELRVKSTKS